MSEDEEGLVFSLQHLSGSRKGLEEHFQGPCVSLGRGRSNLCSFDAEKERSVSHRHCEIRVEEGSAVLYDVGSLNGTFVNGQRVRSILLGDGDEIGLGREGPRLRFQICSAPGPVPGKAGAENRAHAVAETRPRRLTGIEPAAEGPRRRRRFVLPSVLVVLMVSAALIILDLRSRLTSLERSAEPQDKRSGAELRGGALPLGVPARTLLVGLRLDDARGELLLWRELGAGVPLAPGRVLVPQAVVEQAEALLSIPPDDPANRLSLMVAPGGDLGGTLEVKEVIEPPGPPSPTGLALLLLARGGEMLPRVLLSSCATTLQALVPGLAPFEVTVTACFDSHGFPVSDPGAATLLKITGLPHTAGTPLFHGGGLGGLGVGPSAPGLAVAAPAIARFFQEAETLPSRPLRGR